MPAGTIAFSTLSIDENTPPNTEIGTVTINDEEGVLIMGLGGSISGQDSSYYLSLVDNGDGTGTILTGPNAFDYETLSTQDLYVFYMDYEGNEQSAPFTLTVNDVDEAADPVATNDTVAAGKNIRSTIDVLANDTDSDGTIDPTTVTVVDGPDHGTLSVNATTGVITYTPTKDYIGSDSFTYTVKDNDGNVSGEATVTIGVDSKLTLTSSNEAFAADAVAIGTVEVDGGAGDDYLSGSSNPSTAGADKFYGGEGNDIIFGATGNDYIEGNAGNDYLRSGSGNDTLVGGEGTDTYGIRFFANKTSSTLDTGTVTIIDDDGVLWNGAPRSATVPTEWSSQPPAAAGYQIAGTATITGAGTWDLVVADDNGGTKTFALILDGDDLKIVGGNETVTIKDYVNGTFGITLEEPESPIPTATDDTVAAGKNIRSTIDVLANDTDSDGTIDPTTVTVVDGPDHGTFSINATTGVITYTPTKDYIGSDSFTYTVKDNDGNVSGEATVTIGVDSKLTLTSSNEAFAADAVAIGTVEVDGGAGDDYLSGSSNPSTAGADKFYGGEGNDIIFGATGNDYIEGNAGNDYLRSGSGNDTLVGGEGTDTYGIRFFANKTSSTLDTGTVTIIDDDGVLWNGAPRPATVPSEWSSQPPAAAGYQIAGTATITGAGTWDLVVADDNGGTKTFALILDGDDLKIVGGNETVTIKDYVNGTFGITLAAENQAPTDLALSNDKVDENSGVGTVVGTLSATDPEGGAVTYALAEPNDYFEIVGNQIKVKGALDYETIASHDLTIVASDADGLTTEQTFAIEVNDLDDVTPEPAKGTITIDVSGSGSAGVDFEAYMRGGFISDTVGGGFPSFDNSSDFFGEEMFIGYGTGATSKYVLAHGNLEYSFGTHTIAGEINTIEFGTRGAGSFDSNGYYTGGNSLLKITGLDFANAVPTNTTEEAIIEANGLVHLFGIAHMYGNSSDPATAAKVAEALNKIADGLDDYAQHFIGSAGADIYAGTHYGDEIEGGAGNDLLSGGGGDDSITGGAGSNVIAGGFGSDSAVYDGLKSGYTVTDNGDGTFSVLDKSAGSTDTLTGVELLRFKDVIVDLTDGSEVPAGEPPEDIELTSTTIAENAAVGTIIGTLSAVDPDGGTVSFALTGAVSDKFEIVGNQLRLKAGVDFETAESHQITVRATDSFGSSADQTFTIGVTNVNEAPVGLGLTKTTVAESAVGGIGTLFATDPEKDALTYTLGADTDGKFAIVGDQLRVKNGLNYEADSSHPITVIVKDAAGNSTSRSFTIKVSNVDEAPESVTLTKTKVAENASINTTVGMLKAVDPEKGAVVYSFSSNPGGMFKLVGNKLQVAKTLNFEAAEKYTIKVNAIDVGGNVTEKTLTIGIEDVNEAPNSVTLSKTMVAENTRVGTTVGTFLAVDPERKALTYTLTDNAGGLFKLNGNKLQVAKGIDFEKVQGDTITVVVKDAGGLTVPKTFTIGVTDVLETITGTSASQTLKGGIGADKIVAGAGNDTLMGFGGNDLLYGGTGKDTLYGGLNADDLTGGSGSDSFQFKALSDSTVASSGRDTIFDFSGIGGDRIDLSGIDASTRASGDQAFSFLGTAGFTGKAGELRYEKKASDTYVYADVNGDKKADFAIHLDDAVTLSKGYFVL